jgi:hypothetical protein
MRLKRLALAMFLAAPLTMPGAYAKATEFSATYSGFEEVGALNAETGAIFSPGTATLDLNLDRNARTLTFKLTFSGLSAPVTIRQIGSGVEINHVFRHPETSSQRGAGCSLRRWSPHAFDR